MVLALASLLLAIAFGLCVRRALVLVAFVDECFYRDEVCGWCPTIEWTMYSVASDCDSCPIDFFLVRSVIAADPGICDVMSSVGGNTVFANEPNNVGTFRSALYPLGKLANLVAK